MAKLNGEKTKVGPVVLEKEGETVTGKRAANLFIKQYADISDIEIDKDRRRQIEANPPLLFSTMTLIDVGE